MSPAHTSEFSSRIGLGPPFARRVSSNFAYLHKVSSVLKVGRTTAHGEIRTSALELKKALKLTSTPRDDGSTKLIPNQFLA